MFWFVLLATCYCAILGQDVEPKIVLDAEDYNGFPEHFQYLSVDANHGTGFTYRWHHNGKLIDDKYKLPFIGQSSRLLRISDQGPKKEYAGTYQFFMDTPVGSIAGRNVSVDFTYVGEFYDPKLSDVRDVVVGQAAFIICPKHRPGNNFIYKWGKTSWVSGTKFVKSASNYIVLDNGTLFFSYLKNKDVAYINDLDVKCGMEANVGKDNRFTWSHVVNLKNQSKNFTKFGPVIVTKLPVKKFTVGETIYLKCAATGNPVPSYSWKVIDTEENEKTLVDGENDIYFADGDPRILEIKPKKSHAGKYVCTATIGQKSDSTQGELIYEEEPAWINGEKIKSVRPSIYSSHSWQCNATGSPTPTYTWYWNGKELKDSSAHNINGGRISFPSLLKEDTGMYECVAHNRLNNIYQIAFLDVQAEKPTFDENSRNTTLFLNSQGTIKCHANAAPVATNTWTKDGVNIGATLSQYKVINNQDLVITRVSKSDIGKYTCTAKNVYGKDTMTILVKVIGEITFISAPQNSTVDLGNTLKLNCEAKDEAKDKITIKYKWRFNKKDLMIEANVYWSLASKTLIILDAQVSQSGIYECIAYIDSPSYAEKKRSAKVIVRAINGEIQPSIITNKNNDYFGFMDKFTGFTCEASGTNLKFSWRHKDLEIDVNYPLKFHKINSPTLQPLKGLLTVDYEGTYQCFVSNTIGTIFGRKATVKFTVVGEFIEPSSKSKIVDVTVGKPFALHCPSHGYSNNVRYKWVYQQANEHVPLPPSRRYFETDDGTLYFSSITSQDVNYIQTLGGIHCQQRATFDGNQVARISLTITLRTRNQQVVKSKPVIKTKIGTKNVFYDATVVFNCGAVGNPIPDLKWYKVVENTGERTEIIQGQSYQLRWSNRFLAIRKVNNNKKGVYLCVANNSLGEDEARGKIIVRDRPQWTVRGEITDVHPAIHSRFIWECKAFGGPTYAWYKNGRLLSKSAKKAGRFVIDKVSEDDNGMYQCTAGNERDTIYTTARLLVKAPTRSPLKKCNVTKMNVMFLVDGSGSVPSATFKEFKKFMQLLVMKFTVGAGATRVGVLQYSSKLRTGFEFAPGEYQTIDAIQNAISKVKYHYGAYTYAGYAMGIARELLALYSHKDAKNVIIILMDDGTWDKTVARKHSKELREKGTQIVILDTSNIMHEIADMGLEFKSDKLRSNVEKVARKICT